MDSFLFICSHLFYNQTTNELRLCLYLLAVGRRTAVVVCKARTRLQRPTLHFTHPLFPFVLTAIVNVRPRQINHDFGVKENGELRRADRRKIL